MLFCIKLEGRDFYYKYYGVLTYFEKGQQTRELEMTTGIHYKYNAIRIGAATPTLKHGEAY